MTLLFLKKKKKILLQMKPIMENAVLHAETIWKYDITLYQK